MSVHVSSWVWRESKAKGADLLLLLALADIADHSGFAWPSVDALAQHVRLDDRRSVQRGLQRLLEAGAITFEAERTLRGRGRKNVYRVVGPWCEMDGAHAALTSPPPLIHKAEPRLETRERSGRGGVDATLTSDRPPGVRKGGVDATHNIGETAASTTERAASKAEKGGVSVPRIKGTEPSEPSLNHHPPQPPALSRGGSSADEIEGRLLREHGRRLDRRQQRKLRHRVRIGESPDEIYASLEPPPIWDPPPVDSGAQALWDRIRERIRKLDRMSSHSFATWFLPVHASAIVSTQPEDAALGCLVLVCPSGSFAEWFDRNYAELVREFAFAEDSSDDPRFDVRVWFPEAA